MDVFNDYARFYDLLYQDKDYKVECDFLEKVFSEFSTRRINSILDLGCGTGAHSLILSKKGFHSTGIDQSKTMINQAKEKALKENLKIEFFKKDIRTMNLHKKFDAIILMFAVFSYQTKNADVKSVFRTIKKHLNPGGVFFFDCWFGPAVLNQKPTERIKKMNLGSEEIIRTAKPILDLMNNTVTVNYSVFKKKADKTLNMIKENHAMRYFFPLEIYFFANNFGLKILKICPFMSLKRKLSFNDWNMAVIGTV